MIKKNVEMNRSYLKTCKNYFFRIRDILSTFRYWLKLQLFKSPMEEYASLKYTIYKLKAQLIYFFSKKKFLDKHNISANKFNKSGYAVFSNYEIEKNNQVILNKIYEIPNVWNEKNTLDYSNIKGLKNEFIKIFNNGVDEFIKSAFKSDYKIFYHILYRSKNTDEQIPEGSSLWHADGGPGICMNLMICHTPVNNFNGAMKVVSWNKSKNLLAKTFYNYKKWYLNQSEETLKSLDRISHRLVKCESLKKLIVDNSINYFQPNTNKSGLIYAFNNNCVHAGGFTNPGFERIVSVMHIYPSNKITSLRDKFEKDLEKKESYPKNL